ncbi:MAG: hypothetical protein M3X11_06195 [Acidobacteriota bacterium]|nr:hypothetical protein [Acidobacteriota bacterium]
MGWVSLREDIIERLTLDLTAIRDDKSSDADEVRELKINALIKTCESVSRALSKDLELATDPSIDLAIQFPKLKKELDKCTDEIAGLHEQNCRIDGNLRKERERVEALTRQLEKANYENSLLKEGIEEAEVKVRMMNGKVVGWKDETLVTSTPNPKKKPRKGKTGKDNSDVEPPGNVYDLVETLSSKWAGKP